MDEKEKGAEQDDQLQDGEMMEHHTVASPANNEDRPPGNRWGGIVSSFLVGALLTFVLTYFVLGLQNDEVVAVVNGEEITQDEFVETVISGGGAQALDQLITKKLIEQKAKQDDVSVDDETYEARLAEVKEQFPSEEIFEQTLAQEGLTEELFREQMMETLLLEEMLASDLEVSDEDIHQFFDENQEQFGEPEQVRAKQIIVSSEEEAKDAHQRLVDGEDFAKVAEDVSVGPQMTGGGGDAEIIMRGQLAQMDPDLEEKIFALDEGELSDPLESMTGYYIVQIDDKIPAKAAQLDEDVTEQITEQLKHQRLQEKVPELVDNLRQDADIDNRLVPEAEDIAPIMPG